MNLQSSIAHQVSYFSCCLLQDGTEESDRLVGAGADRVGGEDSGDARVGALAVDEEDDAAEAATAAGGLVGGAKSLVKPQPGGAAHQVGGRPCALWSAMLVHGGTTLPQPRLWHAGCLWRKSIW